ncbi:hypothetical protein Tco_1530927 [Tanacetum coccineum]
MVTNRGIRILQKPPSTYGEITAEFTDKTFRRHILRECRDREAGLYRMNYHGRNSPLFRHASTARGGGGGIRTRNLGETLLEVGAVMMRKERPRRAKNIELGPRNRSDQASGYQYFKLIITNYVSKFPTFKVEQRCAKMDAHLDKLSMDFDEELYPHMMTAIGVSSLVIRHRLAVWPPLMKCADSRRKLRLVFAIIPLSLGSLRGMSEG